MRENRNQRYDFYKGLLIFGVIWGHIITVLKNGSTVPSSVLLFLRTYDMPMFAFITGVFLKKSSEKYKWYENVLNKIGGILVPTIIWNLLFKIIFGDLSLYIGRFWFLWSIFFCSCIIIIIDGSIRFSEIVKCLVMICTIIFFHMGIVDKWNIGFLIFPCIVGFYYEKIKILVKKILKIDDMFPIKALVIFIFIVLQCFWTTQYNVWNTGCNIFSLKTPVRTSIKICYRGIIGISGCIVMKMVFNKIYDILIQSNYQWVRRIRNGVVVLGQHTLELYILQNLFVENIGKKLIERVIDSLGKNIFLYNIHICDKVWAPCSATFLVIFLYFLQKWIREIPIIGKYIFGIPLAIILGKYKKRFQNDKNEKVVRCDDI